MTYLLVVALVLAPTEAQVLHGVRGVESSFGVDRRDGERHRKVCQRAVGDHQVRPIAVRELVRVGELDASTIPEFSLDNCAGIRRWLRDPTNNELAARLYLRLMVERAGGLEAGLCLYNGKRPGCLYAGQVLQIATGESP